ncbi:unnamed protein product [Sphenostylis stenocarpa]|uniref:Uncharacterized protein n=1 Tax=Sphenostylis stenocarpa TaxID=92480 RepID=A0AA86RXL0_9FABA|nr:unnamed protein product [Sphenostylis stenocarpa]
MSKGGKIIDFDWIKEFLDLSDEESKHVVLSEVKIVDDDDDDCVILDGDPENRVTTLNDSPTESDELLVVGEKGQIACRDYPHPRHLCVKFPFSSTPHEKHCDQCHCYVCDSVAPCLKWGTGLSGTDHCHATDKSETWRTLRKNFILGKAAPSLVSTNGSTLGDVTNVQHNHSLPLDIRLLSPNFMLNETSMATATHTCSPVNFIPQSQASRSVIMHTHPPLNSRPNIGRCRESGSTLLRNRYQSRSIPQRVLGVRNHGIQRVKRHGNDLGPQFLSSHAMLEGLGSVGVRSTLPMNHSTHGASAFSNSVNHACATGFSNNKTCYGENDVYVPQNLLYPFPCSQKENLSSVNNRITNASYESQACYDSNGSQTLYAYSVQGSNDPSSHVVGLGRNQSINEQQTGCQNENACGNVTQSGTAIQYFFQQKHHDACQIESALRADFSAFHSSRIEVTNQSMTYLQGSDSMNTSSNVKESGTQFPGSTGLGSVDDIKRWLFNEENSVLDDTLASELNMPYPDADMLLFDFDNYWDCLAFV